MIRPTKLKFAIEFATYYHRKQTRKDGSPYVEHPKRVSNFVGIYTDSAYLETLKCAAVLHDIVEDTEITGSILMDNFGIDVTNLVLELTSDPSAQREMGKANYLADKMIHMSSKALFIKLCDRLDNVQDLNFAPDSFKMRYITETLDILNQLKRDRKLSELEIKVVFAILSTIDIYVAEEERLK